MFRCRVLVCVMAIVLVCVLVFVHVIAIVLVRVVVCALARVSIRLRVLCPVLVLFIVIVFF